MNGTELAVKLLGPLGWVEPEHGRFLIQDSNWDEGDSTLMTRYVCVGFVSYKLAAVTLHSSDGSEREWNDTAGVIILHTLEEGIARGAAVDVGHSFTASVDSDGKAWSGAAALIRQSFPADQTSLSILNALTTAGVIEWSTRGRELLVYSPGHGVDRGTGADRFYVGRYATEFPVSTSIADAATVAIVRGDDGTAHEFAGADTLGLGRLERANGASGTTDSATLTVLGQLAAAQGGEKQMYTVTENTGAMDAIAGIDYSCGDYVMVWSRTGKPTRMRVSEIQVRRGSDHTTSVDIILEDRLTDLTARLAKRAASLGASLTGSGMLKGSGGIGGGGGLMTGTIDAGHIGFGPARVLMGGSLTEPLGRLASYQPYANDVVVVGSVAGANTILGRLVDSDSPVPVGSGELLELGEGWEAYDVGRYGEPSIRRMSSDWVILSGVLRRRGVAGTTMVLRVQPVYVPARPKTQFQATVGDTTNGAAQSSSGFRLELDTTGALTLLCGGYAGSADPADAGDLIVSLNSVWYNISTSITMFAGSTIAGFGTDPNGTSWTFGSVQSLATIPEGKRPDRARTIPAMTPGYFNAWNPGQVISPAYGVVGSTNGDTTSIEGGFWQTADGAQQYEWTDVDLINGFTHDPNQHVQYAKAGGIGMLRGIHESGVSGQSMGQLPPGMRPSSEIITRQNIRLTAGGNLISAGYISTGRWFDLMWVIGR
ncbi:hypothetical protein [Cryobacterium sp. MP_3.1]|uniref:hypothetical protein n=1 Tax=Cryobacterium sp. MP_3.1 TaxID=3071711 RepID=UPI002E1688DB